MFSQYLLHTFGPEHVILTKTLNLRTAGKCSPEYMYMYYDSNNDDLYYNSL